LKGRRTTKLVSEKESAFKVHSRGVSGLAAGFEK
jgi:hypothetical protein